MGKPFYRHTVFVENHKNTNQIFLIEAYASENFGWRGVLPSPRPSFIAKFPFPRQKFKYKQNNGVSSDNKNHMWVYLFHPNPRYDCTKESQNFPNETTLALNQGWIWSKLGVGLSSNWRQNVPLKLEIIWAGEQSHWRAADSVNSVIGAPTTSPRHEFDPVHPYS